MNTDKKIIAVVGATGAQGSGLVRAVLGDRESPFRVRAVTRNPKGDRALELAKLGAEVVAADLDDPDSVKQAFRGANAAFCVTNFWEHFSGGARSHSSAGHGRRREGRGRGARGLVHPRGYSAPDPSRTAACPPCRVGTRSRTSTARARRTSTSRPAAPRSRTWLASFYWDNFVYFGMGPKRGPDGKLKLILPLGDSKLPGIAAQDIGPAAYGVFKSGSEFAGQYVGVAGEQLTGEEMASRMSAVMEPVTYSASHAGRLSRPRVPRRGRSRQHVSAPSAVQPRGVRPP